MATDPYAVELASRLKAAMAEVDKLTEWLTKPVRVEAVGLKCPHCSGVSTLSFGEKVPRGRDAGCCGDWFCGRDDWPTLVMRD